MEVGSYSAPGSQLVSYIQFELICSVAMDRTWHLDCRRCCLLIAPWHLLSSSVLAAFLISPLHSLRITTGCFVYSIPLLLKRNRNVAAVPGVQSKGWGSLSGGKSDCKEWSKGRSSHRRTPRQCQIAFYVSLCIL